MSSMNEVMAAQLAATGDAVSDVDPQQFVESPISAIEDLTIGVEGPVQTDILGGTTTLVARPDHFKEVLVTNADAFEKGAEQSVMRSLLGDGLVTSNGKRWQVARTALRSFFSAKNLNQGMSIAFGELNKSAADITLHPGRRVNAHRFAGELALRMTAAVLFQKQLDEEQAASIYRACSTAHHWLTMKLWQPEVAEKDEKGAANYAEAVASVRAIVSSMRDEESGIFEALEPVHAQFGSEGVFDELLTLLVAGFETTATVSAYAIYALANRPDLWPWLREEADILLDRASDDDASYIRDAPRTRAFVNEALRLYPSAWWFARRAKQDTQIAGVKVSSGDSVLLCPWSLHRQPDLWSKALSFEPARWGVSAVDKFAYLPFGVGARSCIGQHLALTEMTAMVSALAGAFDLTPLSGSLENHRPVGGITLGPSDRPMEVAFSIRSPSPLLSPRGINL
ncbi:MAG: cytochrome P450 [Alphaproteobacteria bacterium]|nr:cytochrome P450 [Alphaproteobacteria bacterium SS10]